MFLAVVLYMNYNGWMELKVIKLTPFKMPKEVKPTRAENMRDLKSRGSKAIQSEAKKLSSEFNKRKSER